MFGVFCWVILVELGRASTEKLFPVSPKQKEQQLVLYKVLHNTIHSAAALFSSSGTDHTCLVSCTTGNIQFGKFVVAYDNWQIVKADRVKDRLFGSPIGGSDTTPSCINGT